MDKKIETVPLKDVELLDRLHPRRGDLLLACKKTYPDFVDAETAQLSRRDLGLGRCAACKSCLPPTTISGACDRQGFPAIAK